MKRSTKIGCGVALVILIFTGTAFIAGGVFYLWQFEIGLQEVRRGYESMRAADYDAAITGLTEALRKPLTHRDRFYAYINRGAAESIRKRYDEAAADFTAAIELDPSMADPYQRRGWVFEQKKEPDKAIADYNRAIERDPNFGPAYYRRAMILYNRDDVEKALPDFNEAIRIGPDHAEAFVMRGLCYLKQNDLDHALANLDAALSIDPKSRRAYEERANVYRRRGEPEKAIFDMAEARYLWPAPKPRKTYTPSPQSKLGPNGTLDVIPLSRVAAKPGGSVSVEFAELADQARRAAKDEELEKAINLYNKALALDIKPAQASFATMERGTCYWRHGDYDKAHNDYEEAIKLNPHNAGAYVDRGVDLEHRGKIDEALKDYEEAMRLDPQAYFAYCYRGIAFFHEGDLNNALIDFAKSIQLNSTKPEAYLFRAAVYTHQKAFAQALTDCFTAIEWHPDSARAYSARAKVFVHMGKYDLAEQDINTEKSLKPKNELLLHNSIAWFRATCPDNKMRNGKEAVTEARIACELVHWQQWPSLDNLAAAEAEIGDFRQAVNHEEQALHLNVPPVYRGEVEDRLKLYRQHKPYRDFLAN